MGVCTHESVGGGMPFVKSGGTITRRKLFCNQPTRGTDTHTHLASLACVVSCWRLVASLCRFARSLCVCVGGGSPKRRVKVHSPCSCVRRWSNLEGGNHKAKTTKTTMTMLRKLFCNQTFLQATNASRTDTQRHRHSPGRRDTHTSPLLLVLYPAGAS